MQNTEDTPIATIPKNAREELRLQIRTLHGRRMLDFRAYADNGVGKVATPKGIAIKPELVRALITALEQAEQAAKKEGLIG